MKKLQKGFTLIELMTLVAIIAILAAVAAPKFGSQIQKAQDAKGIQVVGTWRSGLMILYTDNGVYPKTLKAIEVAVDKGTTSKTFNSNATTTVGYVVGRGNTAAWVKVGTNTGQGTGGKAAIFGLYSASTTDSEINFTAANGKDTKGTSWTAY